MNEEIENMPNEIAVGFITYSSDYSKLRSPVENINNWLSEHQGYTVKHIVSFISEGLLVIFQKQQPSNKLSKENKQ